MAAGLNNLNPFGLDEVKPKQTWRPGVNNLNPFSLDEVKRKQTWRLGLITSTLLVWTK